MHFLAHSYCYHFILYCANKLSNVYIDCLASCKRAIIWDNWHKSQYLRKNSQTMTIFLLGTQYSTTHRTITDDTDANKCIPDYWCVYIFCRYLLFECIQDKREVTKTQGWASVLFKRTFRSFRSFPFFIKERFVLSVLFHSL